MYDGRGFPARKVTDTAFLSFRVSKSIDIVSIFNIFYSANC